MDDSAQELCALFLKSDIRVRGTVFEPLFCAADVGNHVRDEHYRRSVSEYDSKHCCRGSELDALGRPRRVLYLTERGLYRYLLQSRRPEALGFQDMVFGLLVAARLRVVDGALLAAKIACDEVRRVRDEAKAEDARRQAESAQLRAESAQRDRS